MNCSSSLSDLSWLDSSLTKRYTSSQADSGLLWRRGCCFILSKRESFLFVNALQLWRRIIITPGIYQWTISTLELLNFCWKLKFPKITSDFTHLMKQELLKGLDFHDLLRICSLRTAPFYGATRSLVTFQKINQWTAPQITGPGDRPAKIMY